MIFIDLSVTPNGDAKVYLQYYGMGCGRLCCSAQGELRRQWVCQANILRPEQLLEPMGSSMMIVGTLIVDLIIADSNSLKDKRHVVKSLLDGIRHRYNVTAAEIGDLDKLRRSAIGFACVSNSRDVVDSMLSQILRIIESDPRIEVKECQVDVL